MSFHRPVPPRPGQHRRPARLQTVAGLVAAVAVALALALGGYAVLRMHAGAATAARQDSASVPCASAAGQDAAGCRSARAGGAGSGSSGPSGGPGRHTARARPGAPGRRRVRSARPRPTPSARTHSAPPPGASPSPTATPSPPPSSSPPPAPDGSAAGQVLALINSARAQAGLPAYTISSGLDLSARRHTAVMAGGCGLSHQCPGEAALGDRLSAAGVSWTAAGENIGEGGPEAATDAAIAHLAVSLTQDMLNERPPDDGHRQNILSSSFHHVGIYVFRDSRGTVWMTQDFSS